MGDADVNQARLLPTGDDFDGKPSAASACTRKWGVLGNPQGIGRHGPDGIDRVVADALLKQRKAPRPRNCDAASSMRSGTSRRQAHGLL